MSLVQIGENEFGLLSESWGRKDEDEEVFGEMQGGVEAVTCGAGIRCKSCKEVSGTCADTVASIFG